MHSPTCFGVNSPSSGGRNTKAYRTKHTQFYIYNAKKMLKTNNSSHKNKNVDITDMMLTFSFLLILP